VARSDRTIKNGATMIDIGTDKKGHSLRTLLWQALSKYETEALFQFVLDKDIPVRTAAARELQMRRTRKVFKFAAELTTRKSQVAREMGAFILGQIGAPKYPFRKEAVPLLEELSGDDNASVRAAAVAGLGHLKSTRSLEIIASAVSDKSADVRLSVVFALSAINPSEQVSSLLKQLALDTDRDVRRWAASTLTDIET